MPSTQVEDRQRNGGGEKSPRRKVEGDGQTIENLREIVELGSRISKKNSEYEKEITSLRGRNDELERKNKSLNQRLSEVESKSASQTGRVNDTAAKNSTLSKRNSELDRENGELQRKNQELERTVSDQNKKLKTLDRQLKEKQEENSKLHEEIDELKGRKKDKGKEGGRKENPRSEEDEKLLKDKDAEIVALKRERDQVQKASVQVRRELQQCK